MTGHKHVADELTAAVEKVAHERCAEAIKFYRDGRPGRAQFAMVRAGMTISRLVRDHDSLAELEQLRLFEPFRDPRRGDCLGAAS